MKARFRSARRVPTPAPRPFHAFIAYADLAAARRAMGAIDEVLRATEGRFALKPMLWRFDQLAAAKWCDHAIADARHAEVIVLANSAPGALPPALEEWVSRLLSHTREHRLTLVSLQGDDDAWTISLEPSAARSQVRTLAVAA